MITCRVCGQDNPATNRFCGACAAPLEHTEAAPQIRKTVTIVFCDVVGSTAMGEALDPESLRQVMERYFAAMRSAIEHHGGSVEKFIGDAVMAVFGVPVLHEDDALRAVRAAAEMRTALAALNEELDRDHGMTLACRIGVNTGEVVAGAGDQTLVTGDAVNVAARLEQAAKPGEILLGWETFRLTRDAIEVETVEALDLKGKSEPVPAFRLIRAIPGVEGHTRRMDSAMVGRDSELQLLTNAFARSKQEHACVLFTLLGSAGVGKSRLSEEFIHAVDDARVLRGRCLHYGEGITYWPIVEVLTQAAGIEETETPEEAREKLDAILVGADDAEIIATRLTNVMGIGGEAAPDETFWAIRRFFECLAAREPVVVILDDIQWGESTLLDLIEHLSDWSRDAPIFVLCMARPELLDDRPGWGGGKMNASTILLEPLPEAAGDLLLSNLLGASELDAGARERILTAAGGNPLFVEEMLDMLVEQGLLVLDDGRWIATSDLATIEVPPTISALLTARLDRLPQTERTVLEHGSVEGQVFHRGAVTALDDGAAEGAIGRNLMDLVRKELIRPDRAEIPADDAFRFRHLLIRDAAYDAIPKATRAELHERFAGWLDGLGGLLGERDEIVGYHLEQAYRYRTELGPEGEPERRLAEEAGRRLASAGATAGARRDLPASINLLSRAASLFELDDPRRLSILSDLGGALAEAGDLAGARTALVEAAERAEAAGDDLLRTHVVIQRWDALDEGDGDARLDAERALAVFEAAGDERGMARAWRVLAGLSFRDGACRAADDALQRALVHARNAGDVREQTSVYAWLGIVLALGPTPIGEAIRRCQEVLEENDGNRSIAAEMYHAMAHLRARQGAFDDALSLAARCRDILWENGAMWWYWVLAEVIWDIKVLMGEPGEATEVLTEAYGEIERMGDSFLSLSAFLARSLYEMERFEDAQRRAEAAVEAVDDRRARGLGLGVLAKLWARQGRLEEAAGMAEEAVALFSGTEFSIFRPAVLMDRADVLRMAGRPHEAISVIQDALLLYEQREDVVSADHARRAIEELAAG